MPNYRSGRKNIILVDSSDNCTRCNPVNINYNAFLTTRENALRFNNVNTPLNTEAKMETVLQ